MRNLTFVILGCACLMSGCGMYNDDKRLKKIRDTKQDGSPVEHFHGRFGDYRTTCCSTNSRALALEDQVDEVVMLNDHDMEIAVSFPKPYEEISKSIETFGQRQTFVAFGDWGYAPHVNLIDRVGAYLGNLESSNELDAVFLLGDNFYPEGVTSVMDPSFSLFTNHLAKQNSNAISYYVLLGNHDALGNTRAQIRYEDPKWKIAQDNYFREFRHNGLVTCVWFVHDHLSRTTAGIEQVTKLLEQHAKSCTWRIFATHIPISTVGVYRESNAVDDMFEAYNELLEKFQIHAYICGHEHTSQYIVDPRIANTAILIAGEVGWQRGGKDGSVRFAKDELKWFNADLFPTVLKIEATSDLLSFKYIHLPEAKPYQLLKTIKIRP